MTTAPRLEGRRRRFGADLYALPASSTTRATDEDGRIAVTVDGAGDVVDVEVVEDHAALRTVDGLSRTVRSALVRAEGQRSLRSATESGLVDRLERGVERPFTVEHRPARRLTILAPDQAEARAHSYWRHQDEPMRPRTSANGYLTVGYSSAGVPDRVEADPEWLAATTRDYLTKALKETLIR